ncbi:hypothetical protein CcaverHIS002_0105410 [Cutaneotrichosporon cavernicola]|nr:hypothetical protein CcaverHIS002_0105410 [Cutaneotrichosporon cavernicola]
MPSRPDALQRQCGNKCASDCSCVGGKCTTKCKDGQTLCNGKCVDTNTDSNNCGKCGNKCTWDCTCTGGECTDKTKLCCAQKDSCGKSLKKSSSNVWGHTLTCTYGSGWWHWKKGQVEERTFGKLSSCVYDSKTGALSGASWWNSCCPKTLAKC